MNQSTTLATSRKVPGGRFGGCVSWSVQLWLVYQSDCELCPLLVAVRKLLHAAVGQLVQANPVDDRLCCPPRSRPGQA